MNIIADIAGQHDALMRLVDRMPHEKTILVGDLIDRGPNSKEVIQWAIDTEGVKTLLGNHEHMMIDYYDNTQIYDQFIWVNNGGGMTLSQYRDDKETLKTHLEWLKQLPLYYKQDDILVTHAAWSNCGNFVDACKIDTFDNLLESVIWSREQPEERDFFQVFGHNSHWGLRWFGETDNPWAVCLDASREAVVTGMHWPSKKIFQEPYLTTEKPVDTGL